MDRLLSRAWTLGDVDDVEALASSVLDRELRRFGVHTLEWADRDDMLSELLERTWRLWERYDPARGGFASYASYALRFEVVEVMRRRFGRNGHRRAPAGTVSLEQVAGPDGELPAGVERTLAPDAGDDAPDRALGRSGLLPRRDRADLQRAAREVADIARTAKGVGRLMAELRAELLELEAA